MNLTKIKNLFKIRKCSYYIDKYGKILYIPNYFSEMWCLLKSSLYKTDFNFTILNGIDEDEIVKKLLVFVFLKHNNMIYYKETKKSNTIILLNNNIKNINNIDLVSNYLLTLYDKTDNLLYLYAYFRTIYSNKIKNKDILIEIFYKYFINRKGLLNLHINIDNISNYQELLKILKRKKIIDQFYNVYGKYMINMYKDIYNNIVNNMLFKKHKKIHIRKYKSLKDININTIINKYIDNSFNKKYIKSELKRLSKIYIK